MSVKIVLSDTDKDSEDYKLLNESGAEISTYTVEKNKARALISYFSKKRKNL